MTKRTMGNHACGTSDAASDRPKTRLILASALLLVAIGAFVLVRTTVALFSMYLVAAAILLCEENYVFITFFRSRKTCCFGKTDGRLLLRLLVLSAGIALLLEAGTLFGAKTASPFSIADWRPKRMALFFFVVFSCLLLMVEYLPVPDSERLQHSLLRGAKSSHVLSFFDWKMLVVLFALFVCVWLAFRQGMMASGLASIFILAAFLCLGVLSIVILCRDKAFCPERVFATIALAAGVVIIIAFPVGNLFSWDDQIHYQNALSVSFLSDVEETSSDRMQTLLFNKEDGFSQDASFGRGDTSVNNLSKTWSWDEIYGYAEQLDSGATAQSVNSIEGVSTIVSQFSAIAYIPSACGLWLGRFLHASFSMTFVLGRLFNLLSYVTIVFFAIRIIPTKKSLLTIIALLPTNVFLAANYSYDAWLTSFFMLGTAMAVREFSEERLLTTSRAFALFLVFLVGLGPKAVYFPMLAILMLMPSSKFESKAQKRRFYIAGVAVALLAVATFVLPFLSTKGGGGGDYRGGSGVNSSAQTALAFQDPISFARTIVNFMFGIYLAPASIDSSLVNFAYLSFIQVFSSSLTCVPLLFVTGVALTDCSSLSARIFGWKSRLWVVFLSLVTIFLSCTALYVSFTPVGLPTVNGMQTRYLLPLVFPVCALALGTGREKSCSEGTYCAIASSFSLALLAFSLWVFLLARIS